MIHPRVKKRYASLVASTLMCLVAVICAAVTTAPCDRSRRVFTESSGIITDGPSGSNYTQDSHCEWLIKAKNASQFITLKFRSMGTECSYDYVFVYDGDSYHAPLLGSFSGKTEPQQIIATSGYMLILLYSDTNYVLDGFKAEFSVSNCPNNCSDRGVCASHTCVCSGDWGGKDCSIELCPIACSYSGHCIDGRCQCRKGYSGRSCSLDASDYNGNKWHWLSYGRAGGLTPRAAHSAVYINYTDSIYVFGGYNLNKVLGSLQIYRFDKSQWEDEYGHVLRDQSANEFDPHLLAEFLKQGDLNKWGVNQGSFLNHFLQSAFVRKYRSSSHYGMSVEEIDNGYFPPIAAFLNSTFNKRANRPAPRYGHAACQQGARFILYGGKLDNGSLSNELWAYDVIKKVWSLRAINSSIVPPALTRHTLTTVKDNLYLFGGSTQDGEFSSRLFKIKLNEPHNEQWYEVHPRGGKELDIRVVAHSAVYHPYSHSIIVYGGVIAGVARFSKLSDKMFVFDIEYRLWSELHYPRAHLRDTYVPRERAFHSATIVGNYLVIFGGYSHRHNKDEICYDNQMYLYHLGCHSWTSGEVLGQIGSAKYPKTQGVFAHAAAFKPPATLLIVGGYHGNVNGDLIAYVFPRWLGGIHDGDPEAACLKHRSHAECLADPECGWCSADELCYGRTVGSNCTTNLQSVRCGGICPALGDCHSCLAQGFPRFESRFPSVSSKLGLHQCTWCVQNARCHHKDDNYGVCGEDTPSQGPGWWGSTGTEVMRADLCRTLDRRPGLTFIKYLHPPDWTHPDHVAIINATTVDFNAGGSSRGMDINNGVVARLRGYLHLPPSWENRGETLRVCAGHAKVELFLGDNILSANLTTELSQCVGAGWPQLQPGKLTVDLHANKSLTNGHFSAHQQSKMELQHNRSHENARAFTFEYLEPYSNGTCSQYDNCLHCLTDSECGWCELTEQCMSRSEDEIRVCRVNNNWRFLTLQPSFCPNCSNYITCSKCVNSNCEWWVEDARCGRKGRLAGAVKVEEECPQPCHTRKDCSTCLDERGRCVWCEATQQCFSFSVYTSEYQFGLCREWLDRTISPNSPGSSLDTGQRHIEQCKSCAQLTNCSSCLQSLSCGWCHSRENPIKGACMQGDFGKPHANCSVILNITADEAQWAYAQCPDVDECGLGLHDCHPKAVCTNTHGSYSCKCLRGFIGDGRTSCTQTCYNNCAHGYCLGAPEFICQCDLGWTGADCALNCGCNNHSTCNTGIGVCDQCQDWTEGEFCDKCKIGSYGNATSSRGCRRCDCNGHGDEELGVCDVQTGVCYCKDNTEGSNCEKCSGDFYGDPRHGGRCYFQCEARGMLYDNVEQGLGSHKAHTAIWGGPPVKECLWIISPKNISNGAYIQLTINSTRMNVPCSDNSVYVYDGLPDLGNAQQSQLIGVFCNDASPVIVESRSGHLTVHYKQGVAGQGFEAVYKVLSCDLGCPTPRVCKLNQCVCPDGFTGLECEREICPKNCSAVTKQGICDKVYGRCICTAGWGGRDCAEKIQPFNLVFIELFDSQNLADSLDHLRKNLPRFGHSLVTDKRGSLWMFGGYSLSHGPLNDIRLFDTKNSTWMQVTLEATPEAKMPEGRYFHAAEMVHSKQAIYVHGGLSDQSVDGQNRTLGDFWQFSLKEQRWNIVPGSENQPPALAGHTITLQKNQVTESLILIGGFALDHGFNADVWEFDLTRNVWEIMETEGANPIGIYGHSTVYHSPTQSFYVYGGVLYSNHAVSISNKLFVLNLPKKKWNELPTFPELNSGANLPRAKFLHSAVTTDDYMIVFGGMTQPHNATDGLAAYVYNCNQWIQLVKDVVIIGDIPPPVYAHAMTLDPESGALYVVGGWAGAARSTVTKITLPSDLCRLWSGGKHSCRHHMGCSYCTVYPQGGSNSTHCHSIGRSEVCNSHNGTLITNNGAACDDVLIASRSCSNFTTCSSCLAKWPAHPGIKNVCQWCTHCGKGVCISVTQVCPPNIKCESHPLVMFDPQKCLGKRCQATDCNHCNREGCIYTQQVLLTNEGAAKMTSSESIYDWACVTKDAISKVNPKIKELLQCPAKCHTYKDCRACLRSDGAEGAFHECHWATQLNLCLAPSYQSLYCAGGVCGLVLQPKQIEQCPSSCFSFTQCSECLKHAHCGWCARNTTTGDGVCTEGSLDSPTDHPLHSTCRTIYEHQLKVELPPNETISWNYLRCPPENECENGHHSCNPESELCEDLPVGYECVCGPGYRAAGGSCVPVCTQGCVRGSCIRPDVCKCDFGYVGANCSIQCQCNGHAECEGPDKLNSCLECYNNTMGAQCEKCKPQFVGDPTDNGQCVPCLTYCYGHSDTCSSNSDNTSTTTPESIRHTMSPLDSFLVDGPNGNVRCDKCTNNTEGARCEKCISGYFRGSENLRDACRKCQCHGHGDMCDPITGEKCNCGNNTESDATCQTTSSSKNSAQECWRYQCVKCKDSYMGDPKNGHQCYRMISADNRLCFDGKLVDECRTKSSMLNPGQTVFFVIIPKFMNVDIRVTIDVTQGALDVFMSPNDSSFVVTVNSTTGEHHVDLDPSLLRGDPQNADMFFSNRTFFETSMKSRSYMQKIEYTMITHKAEGLISFITVDKKNTLLWVQGLKNRLVLTFPQTSHDLGYTKFYLALKAYGTEDGINKPTQGLLFFRQDQLHIDLFVFFSVFFSCFFLFLAACVVAWKAKQAADVRRARRRHVVEMLHMAKRPFASITLILGPQTPGTQRKPVRMKGNANANVNQVRPIAVEPTADGLAAVTSVLVRLPGGRQAPSRLALASSLVLLGRQLPSSGRTFLRRVQHNTPPPT